MVRIHTLPLGPLQANCFIIHRQDSASCVLVDPGEDFPGLRQFLESKGLTVEAILLTHGHFDHVGAVEALVKETGCSLWLHPQDHSISFGPFTGRLFPLTRCGLIQPQPLQEGQTLSLAGLTFTVLHTPGHTPGSVCFALEDKLFTGDTLFAGACGRTDLPGGDGKAMLYSLERLAALPIPYKIYPGHGESTTLAAEKQYNPYLRQLL